MEFFNGIGKRVNKVVRSVSEKNTTTTETFRITREISAAEAKIEKLFTEFGKACYALKSGEGDAAEAEALSAGIAEAKAGVEALKKELDSLNGVRRCPECNAVLPREAVFCMQCGARQPEIPVKPEEPEAVKPEKEYCPNCGALREDEGGSCVVCGYSFAEAEAAEAEAPAEEAVEEAPAEEAAEEAVEEAAAEPEEEQPEEEQPEEPTAPEE